MRSACCARCAAASAGSPVSAASIARTQSRNDLCLAGSFSLAELGDRGACVTPLSDEKGRLRGVEQIHHLEAPVSGPPGQLRRLGSSRQRLSGVVVEHVKAQAQPSCRLFPEGAGRVGQCRHPPGEHDGLAVAP